MLAQPRGFCAGVVRAIDIVERALDKYGAPVYVYHEIVHNRHVVESLRERGAVFVESVNEIPVGAVCIFSAHGVATTIVDNAGKRQLNVLDATCPLVTKVHSQAQRYERHGYEIIIVGHPGHPEVEGTRGRIRGVMHVLSTEEEVMSLQVSNPQKLAYITQTTLSVDDTKDVIKALQTRFPKIKGPALSDICYATQNRQNAVRKLVENVDVLLVVGAQNSSNSNRLCEVGKQAGIPSYLIADAGDIHPEWLTADSKIGITAGASAPEILVQGVLDYIRRLGVVHIREMDGKQESTTFKIPVGLLATKSAQAKG